jgi:hypothetical protein
LRCPAEESANLEKLQPINARRNSEKIGTRINSVLFEGTAACPAVLFFAKKRWDLDRLLVCIKVNGFYPVSGDRKISETLIM